MENLSGRTAVIIGGTGGIGASTARALADAGATVVVGYNQGRERAKTLIADLPAGRHSALQIRLGDVSSVNAAAQEVAGRYGRADILVNAAGTTRPIAHGDLDALDEELFMTILASNVQGPFSAIRAFAPLLKQSGDGVVVNISSISAFTGSGSNIAYCASKAALDTMTMSLARALGPEIRVLCVSPGAVATDFVAGRDRATLESLAVKTPLQRVVEPEDVAKAVMACITHLRVTTGTRIIVDSGRHLV